MSVFLWPLKINGGSELARDDDGSANIDIE